MKPSHTDYQPKYESVDDPNQRVEVLFSADPQSLAASDVTALTRVDLQWPSGRASLMERVDYLTSIFPFELIDLRETRPQSSEIGNWTARFTYHGSAIDRPRFESNFAGLINRPRQKLAK